MKKTLILSALLVSGLANAAGVSKVITLPTQVTYELKVERTKNNVVEVLNEFKTSTLTSFPTPAGSYKHVPYVEKCAINPEDQITTLTPGTINVGLNTNVTIDEGKSKDLYLVKFVSGFSELLSMDKVNSGKCQVELPRTREWNSTHFHAVKANEQVVVNEFGYNEHNHILHKDEEVKYKILLKVIPQ